MSVHKNKDTKLTFGFSVRGLMLVFVVVVLGIVFYFSSQKLLTVGNSSVTNTVSTVENVISGVVKPSLMPFSDMTIPHLRQRTYESKLGGTTKVNETSTYTSYLTNYDSDGLTVNGLLNIPKGDMPEGGWPAIVFVHGYIPPSIYKTQSGYIAYVDYLSRNGFVVFKIDLRGHDKSDGVAHGAYYSGDYIVDTLNAYTALANSDFVNPKNIGLWGHSMAGNVTFRSFVAKKDIPALVIWAGAVYTYEDMTRYGIDDNSYRPPSDNTERQRRREELRQVHGNFDPNNNFWKQVVPTNYLDGVGGAVQIHHAVNDSVVNVGYSRDLMTVLNKTTIAHELYEYPSGGHDIEGASFNQAMARTVEFYKIKLSR